ncbi:MAG: hypothetical protein KGJ06_01490 [Pseudomonadota bacterium]|nr:hypothetical protein [Pseudomonadota bacterium]
MTLVNAYSLALALVLASGSAALAYTGDDSGSRGDAYSNYQRDPAYFSNTVSDCVHGSTGIAANLDCTRDRANRHTSDTRGNTTDTAYANGNMRQ